MRTPRHGGHGAAEPAAAGSRIVELITTTLLMVSMILSWIAFVDVGFGHHEARVPVFTWITSGDLKIDWSLRIDTLTAVMLVVVTTVSAFVHLYSIGYMEEDPYRPRFFGYLSMFTFAMLMLVTADNLVQMFFGWEGRRARELSADRLLVSQARSQRRRHQGLRRQPHRRFRLRARHLRALRHGRQRRFRHHLRAGAVAHRQDHPSLRLERRRADADLPVAVHGRHGQVGAVPAAHLAARRHGRPDAGLGADPCRHHGDGRRVHGGAAVAAVRACAQRADLRHLHRRHHRHFRRDRRPGAERHQARHRLFDLFAARLHVRRHGRRRLFGRHVPSVHPCLLQGAVVPRLRLGDPRHASRAGHAQHGRAEGPHSLHLRR